jgi:AcrR family transcriptional regulator
MVRWQPGAKQRLRAAALDLYVSGGFEQTTAAEIAASVGLTERTFFRYFADKREVLFDGQELLEKAFTDAVASTAADAPPLTAIAAALEASASFFADDRRGFSRLRQAVIEAHPALRERELLKMASLARALAEALSARGVPADAATLAAETGVTVFKVAFGQWVAPGEERSLVEIELQVMRELAALAAGVVPNQQ